MRKIIVIIFSIAVIVSVALFIHHSRTKNSAPAPAPKLAIDDAVDLKCAQSLYDERKYDQALAIIQQHETPSMIHTEMGRKWLSLLVDVYAAKHDQGHLVRIYEHLPELLEGHELASLLVIHRLIDEEKLEAAAALRTLWQNKETLSSQWLTLDSDLYMANGKSEQAKTLLLSKEFEGKEDTPRLVKLAMLSMRESPKKGLEYLVEAQKKEPDNISIYLLRAKILETSGATELAHFEYLMAAQIAPTNIAVKDELAEFYRRQQHLDASLGIWASALPPPSSEVIWKKFLFWSRVCLKVNSTIDGLELPEGSAAPLLHYFRTLPDTVFWNAAAFEKLPLAKEYLNRHQETLWLRILQLIKDGKEQDALSLLQSNPFRQSYWDPLLEKMISKVLTYRQTGKFPTDPLLESFAAANESQDQAMRAYLAARHPLFMQFNDLCKTLVLQAQDPVIPQDMEILLRDDNAFTALLLAAKWNRAALLLYKPNDTVKTMPLWFRTSLAEAIFNDQGPKAALSFLQTLPETEETTLLMAEVQQSMGNTNDAMQGLEKLASSPSSSGVKAAYLLALINIEQGNIEAAEAVLGHNDAFAKAISGQELAARICLMKEDKEAALKIYTNIASSSLEAKSFLAQKAFEDKDFALAQSLTEEILKENPTNPVLQANYLRMLEINKQYGETATR